MENLPLVKARQLKVGDTIGVFTPSSPAYSSNEGLFVNGIRNLERCGFKVKLGSVTAARASQGYRSASPQDRANELMSLVLDPEVSGIISTIGGSNSSSLIPYLDFAAIRRSRKVICGFSDVTSLRAAILQYAGLRTFYGPSVMCWFGDWPNGVEQSNGWLLEAISQHRDGPRTVHAPKLWSNHKRNWANGDWQKIPREWQVNEGWRVLHAGEVKAPILAFNLNTLMTAAGTSYWPDLAGKILLLEDMDAPQSRNERHFRQLSLMGVFDRIAGLIVGKPEFYDQQGAPFSYEELIMEVVGRRSYPVIANFDCSHTVPMITIPQMTPVHLRATAGGVDFTFLEGAVE